MRLPFPERFPVFPVLVFALVLCCIQQLEGTTIIFSACTFGFITISTLAFNKVDGLTRISGGFIFAYALLVALVGIVYKALLGEPGQSNLQQPELTIEVYLGTVVSMLAAAYIARRFRTKKVLLAQFKTYADMNRAAISCFAIGLAAVLYANLATGNSATGSFFSAFQQLNSFLPLALVFSVLYEIRRSGGRRSLNLVGTLSALAIFAGGIIGYSKQGMFLPFVCWIVTAASQRYKVSVAQVGLMLAMAGFTTYYLVPYSQLGRTYHVEGAPFSENLKSNILLLSNLDIVRKAYNQQTTELYTGTDFSRYYNEPQGLADRLQMITPDDLIINYTAHGGVFGLAPTIFTYEGLIPHFIWKDKPTIQFGNIYAHEIGVLPEEDDTTTGISFSPSGEAFHQAKWWGIFILLPVTLTIFFLVVDSACGDTRTSPIALLAMVGTFHAAPEGGVVEIIRSPTISLAALAVISFIVVYLMPLITNIVIGPAKENMEAPPVFNAAPGRFGRNNLAEQPAE